MDTGVSRIAFHFVAIEVEAVDPIYLAKLVTARPTTAATPGC